MFLQQVNKHSKLLAFALIAFMIGQLFISYKRGMVVSPFFNYGMYSEVIKPKDKYGIFEVIQNGRLLRGQDFTIEQWDKIMLPLQYFAAINKSNELYESDIKRLLARVHISTNDRNFISQCNYQQFETWYKEYLSQVTKHKTKSLAVNSRTYRFQSNTLQLTDTVLPLAQLCH